MTEEKDEQISELESCKKQRDEYLNNWKRAQADFENYKKGEVERAGLLAGYAKQDVLENLLPVIDSIYMAAAAFGKEGFVQIEKQIGEFLKKEGIEEIMVEGKEFDPSTMEAIGESESGKLEEVQKGYKMIDLPAQAGKVIRPAKVKVTK